MPLKTLALAAAALAAVAGFALPAIQEDARARGVPMLEPGRS